MLPTCLWLTCTYDKNRCFVQFRCFLVLSLSLSLWSSVYRYGSAPYLMGFLHLFHHPKPWCCWSVPLSVPWVQSFPAVAAEPRQSEENEKTQAHKSERRNKVTSSLARHTFGSDYVTLLASNFPWIRKTINPITPRENWRAGLGGNLLRSYGVLRERERERG